MKEIKIIAKYIFFLALPIMAGNILQQLYTTFDSVIVGRFMGEEGLAAVGVSLPLISFLTALITGAGIGMTVLFSQKHGKSDKAEYKKSSATALIGGLIIIIPFSLLCIALTKPMLYILQTPPDIVSESSAYLRFVFSGMVFIFLYNYTWASLMSTGNSKAGFCVLSISSFLNIALDILFVGVFGWGVIGAAMATVLVQFLSVFLLMTYVKYKKSELWVRTSELKVEKSCIKELLSYCSAAALQQSILQGGRLAVQGAVNTLGITAIAGYNAAIRVESFIQAPLEGISASNSSYGANQFGAGNFKNIKRGFVSAVTLSMIYNIVISVVIFAFAPHIISIFTDSGNTVLSSGATYLRFMSLCYICLNFTQGFQALFRSVGKLDITIINTILQIGIRVVITYVFIRKIGITSVCVGTLVGWMAMIGFSAYQAVKYFKKVES